MTVFSQSHVSLNNYTGAWETSGSWSPPWASPETNITGNDITINGYITVNGSLSFSFLPSNLIINDTLVILGDLTLGSFTDLTINGNGILIVRGKLTIGAMSDIVTNNYLIITGDVLKLGSTNTGSFVSNDNPVKVFIGGGISPSSLAINKPNFPAIKCPASNTTPYPNSACSYGNMTDIINDPVFSFFETACTTTTPTISTSGATSFCPGGSVTLTSSAASSYLWSNGATTQSIVVTSSGSYSVKVKNATGCQSASSVATIVTVNTLPAAPSITASGPVTFCDGGSVTLTSSTGTSYLWSSGATTRRIDVTTGGSYSLRITDANGCQSNVSGATVVNVNPLPVVNAGNDMTIPNGTSTTINATVTGTGPFTYIWSPAGQLVNSLVEDPATLNMPVTTIFTLKATSLTSSCFNTDAVIINITGGPLNAAPTATPGTVCAGDKVQLYSKASGGSGSNTYTWTSTPAGFTSSQANPTVNPVVSTIYNLSVFDGFNTVNTSVPVTVNASPATPVISAGGPTSFCTGGNVNLTSSAGANYLWSTGETTPGINVSATGNYTVMVTNASGCTSTVSAATAITVSPLPVTPVITASGPTVICEGSSITLTSSPEAVYLWSTGSTTASINANSSGNYTVQVTNSSGCKSAISVPIVVTVNSIPQTPFITANGPATFCEGGDVILASSGGMGFIWSNSATTQSISVTTSGSYSVKTSNAEGCLSLASLPASVSVNALPVVNPGQDQVLESEFGTRMNGVLSSSDTGEWFLISGSGLIEDTHSPTSNVTELSSGDNVFLWKVSDGNCIDSAKVMVTVHGLFVPSVITPDGDGKNDYFRIQKIQGKIELIIINKWGVEEYSSKEYLNNWEGRNNKGSELPADTYFYILKVDNSKIMKGSVLIKR